MLSKCDVKSPLDSKEIKLVNTKGNQAWIFIGRTDTEAEAPILWSPDVKSWLTGKDPDAGKDWGHISVPRDQKSRKGNYYPGRCIITYTQKEVSLLLNNVGENKTLDTQVIKWTSSW